MSDKRSTTIDILNLIIASPSLSLLWASLKNLFGEFNNWDKTGHWETITIYRSLVDAGIPPPNFNLPGHVGIQNLLNSVLMSSATITYFIFSVLTGCLALLLINHIEQ